MRSPRRLKVLIAGMTAAALANTAVASAQTCFTAFGGSIHYQFTASVPAFKAPGTRSLAGVTFGALASCAGLTHWPLVATEVSDRQKIVLGFRAMTVAASGCGAVDYIASVSQSALNGPLQLHNDRNNFSNTSTLTPASCAVVPLVATATAAVARGQKDRLGNSTR
jgi:hypothetical protein